MDFTVGGVELGTKESEVRLDAPGKVKLTVRAGAMLPEKPDAAIRPYADVIGRAGGKGSRWAAELKPYWHVERARIGESRDVKVEVVVNGYPVASQVVRPTASCATWRSTSRSSAAAGWRCASWARRTRIPCS